MNTSAIVFLGTINVFRGCTWGVSGLVCGKLFHKGTVWHSLHMSCLVRI